MKKRKVLPLNKDQLFDKYVNEDYTILQLEELCGCCKNLITNMLHATGLNTHEKRAYKHYKMNEDCFKDISTDVAYILGYFYSVAKIDCKLKTIRIQVKNEDENILDKMCDIVFKIDPNYFISKRDGKEKLLIINRSNVLNDYIKHGYIKETEEDVYLKIKFLDVENQRNFFRGYLEANGNIKFSLNRQYFNLVIHGDKEILKLFQEILNDKFSIKEYSITRIERKDGKVSYRYRTNKSNDIINIYRYLYKDKDLLFSNRHKEVFKDVLYNKINNKLIK